MRVLQGSSSSFFWSGGCISILMYFTGLHAIGFRDVLAFVGYSPGPRHSYSKLPRIRKKKSCIFCGEMTLKRDFLKFPVNVHISDGPYSCSFAHQAHFSCLAEFLAEPRPDMAPRICETSFECPECELKCYRGCLVNAMWINVNKHTKSKNGRSETYTKMLLEWLHLFSENPLLLEGTKNHAKISIQFLVDEIKWALADPQLKYYLEQFMIEHKSILFYYPRNILIPIDDAPEGSEESNRRLNEATLSEISKVFEYHGGELNREAKDVLAFFLFRALETSLLEDFGPRPLYGPILKHLHILTNGTFNDFKEKKVIPKDIPCQGESMAEISIGSEIKICTDSGILSKNSIEKIKRN